jgi:hypothetical protein
VPLIFAAAGIAALIFAGCHGASNANKAITPAGVYSMTFLGNALDASGNPINASRSIQITLDVVKGK